MEHEIPVRIVDNQEYMKLSVQFLRKEKKCRSLSPGTA